MTYSSAEMEMRAVLNAAAQICAAARTAPKARGIDVIRTIVLTDQHKAALTAEMRRVGAEYDASFLLRDADNIDAAQAVILIGAVEGKRGLNDLCGYCHFANCADCEQKGGMCAMDGVDVGIALGSAAAMAADLRMDNRILFSAGRAAINLKLLGEGVGQVFALPLSVSGKSVFFDRKPKK